MSSQYWPSYPKTSLSVISRFRKWKPADPEEALVNCAVTLQWVNSGAYRDVFRIVGFPLVAKFIQDTHEWRANLHHALDEMSTIRHIMRNKRKYGAIQQYIPKVYYFDADAGVTLMREYQQVRTTKQTVIAAEAISAGLDIDMDGWDNHKENFGIDSDGSIVLLDTGYFKRIN